MKVFWCADVRGLTPALWIWEMFICVFIEKQAFKWNQKLYNIWSNDTFKHCEVLRTFLPGSTWYEKHTICHTLLGRPICPQSCCTIFRRLLVQDKAMKNVAIILNYRPPLPLSIHSTEVGSGVILHTLFTKFSLLNRRSLSWKHEAQPKKPMFAKTGSPEN